MRSSSDTVLACFTPIHCGRQSVTSASAELPVVVIMSCQKPFAKQTPCGMPFSSIITFRNYTIITASMSD